MRGRYCNRFCYHKGPLWGLRLSCLHKRHFRVGSDSGKSCRPCRKLAYPPSYCNPSCNGQLYDDSLHVNFSFRMVLARPLWFFPFVFSTISSLCGWYVNNPCLRIEWKGDRLIKDPTPTYLPTMITWTIFVYSMPVGEIILWRSHNQYNVILLFVNKWIFYILCLCKRSENSGYSILFLFYLFLYFQYSWKQVLV